MKPTLQLKLGQHLTMTPQLQQAIRLLQLSTLELQSEVQQTLEENPMLGFRGASRYYSEAYRPGFELECAAIQKSRIQMGVFISHIQLPV